MLSAYDKFLSIVIFENTMSLYLTDFAGCEKTITAKQRDITVKIALGMNISCVKHTKQVHNKVVVIYKTFL